MSRYTDGIQRMLDHYHMLTGTLNEAESLLLDDHSQELLRVFRSGYKRLNWNSLGYKFIYLLPFRLWDAIILLDCLSQITIFVCMWKLSVMSDSLRPHGLYSPWNPPGWNTAVGSLSLPQGIFPTQGLNLGLPHCRRILYQLSHKGSSHVHRYG